VAPHKSKKPTGGGLLSLWRRRELNPGPRGVQKTFVHVRSRRIPDGWVRRFGYDLVSEFLTGTPRGAT